MLSWHKNVEGMKKKIFLSFSQLLLLLLLMTTSCSTKRMVSQTMERDSIRTEHRDSVAERNKDVSDTRHYTGRERLREITRTYIVTPLGDTVKSHVQERETEHTWDSLLSAQRSEIERLHKQVLHAREAAEELHQGEGGGEKPLDKAAHRRDIDVADNRSSGNAGDNQEKIVWTRR